MPEYFRSGIPTKLIEARIAHLDKNGEAAVFSFLFRESHGKTINDRNDS
jgi:hypothetical protein